jgi:hypothetical protein
MTMEKIPKMMQMAEIALMAAAFISGQLNRLNKFWLSLLIEIIAIEWAELM